MMRQLIPRCMSRESGDVRLGQCKTPDTFISPLHASAEEEEEEEQKEARWTLILMPVNGLLPCPAASEVEIVAHDTRKVGIGAKREALASDDVPLSSTLPLLRSWVTSQ
jgi:hypothetical protein